MAEPSDTITAADLINSGITGDLATTLIGMEWYDASVVLRRTLALSAGREGLQRGAITDYVVGGKSIKASLAMIEQAIKIIKANMGSASIISTPFEFGA
jgi:hypothetical protein